MDTYSVKFMSGALQGEWMRHQSYQDAAKLCSSLAELTGQRLEDLYRDSFIWDEHNGVWGAFTYKAWTNKLTFVLYIVREYPDE